MTDADLFVAMVGVCVVALAAWFRSWMNARARRHLFRNRYDVVRTLESCSIIQANNVAVACECGKIRALGSECGERRAA